MCVLKLGGAHGATAGELQPSHADVEGELQEDEFDRAVDAGVTEEQS